MGIPANVAREMVVEVVQFIRSYAVWRELLAKPHVASREAHPDFFLTVTSSMMLAFCVSTYQLFDTNRQTKSLRRLVADIRSSHASLARQLDSQIAAHQPTLDMVAEIRNNVYGHRNRNRHPQDVFAGANLTPRMMKSVVVLAQEVVCALAAATGVGSSADIHKSFRDHEGYALEDSRKVLRRLAD